MAEQVLSRYGWLSRQPKSFQRQVIADAQLQQFETGVPVYHLGDPVGGIYGVASGALAISIAPGEGGPYLTHLGTAGFWIGEGPFLTGEPRRVELVAATQCVLLHVPIHAMERMAAEDPINIRRFAQIAISNVDLALRIIGDLMIAQPERRIAAILVRSAGVQTEPVLRVSQVELGRLANASRKLVNKALRRFCEAGWVEAGYNAIKIRNAEALKAFAAGRS
ncbi:MAG: Crp/Fnr family transcriptional regulator [Hyphomicrobiales bacterium]